VRPATRPAFIISKGIATNEMVVEILHAKYQMFLPLYRQGMELERESGVLLSDSTLCDWVMECGFLLQAISR
jgi:transposase